MMTTMAADQHPRGPPMRRSLEKLQFVGVFLAFCYVFAVAGGLYFSHRLNDLFVQAEAVDALWEGRLDATRRLSRRSLEVSTLIGDLPFAGDASASGKHASEEVARVIANSEVFASTLAGDEAPAARQSLLLIRDIQADLRVLAEALPLFVGARARDDARSAAAALATARARSGAITAKFLEQEATLHEVRSGALKDLAIKVDAIARVLWLVAAVIAALMILALAYGAGIGRQLGRAIRTQERESRTAERDALSLMALNEDVARLNRELSQRLDELRTAQDEIARKSQLARMGELAATVAHELRNPLASIRMATFLVERKANRGSLDIGPQMGRITTGVQRCESIISQLLDFTRATQLEAADIAVDDWLAAVVEEEAERLPATVSIRLELGLGPLVASIDPSRMRRVIVNLMSNAAEAMTGRSESQAAAAGTPQEISIATRWSSRGVEVSVSDTGPGMSADVLARIGEPLFTTKSFGTGLGLDAVKKILALHHGGLDFVSEPGRGACFTAWFPLARPSQGAAA